MLTKIGIIGDIHTEFNNLAIALDFIQTQDAQSILCTGDIADNLKDIDSCCELLIKHNVQTVLGNHDRCFIMNQLINLTPETFFMKKTHSEEYVYGLPVIRDISTIQGELLLCHGIGENIMGEFNYYNDNISIESISEFEKIIRQNRYRFMVHGHSHHRMVRMIDGLTIINAGSLVKLKKPCFGIIDLIEQIVIFYEINFENKAVVSEVINLKKNVDYV